MPPGRSPAEPGPGDVPADREADHAPDLGEAVLVQGEERHGVVVEGKPRAAALDEVALAGELSVDHGDDDAVMGGGQAAVDAGEVAIVDAGPAHAVAADLHQEGGRRVRHEPARQLQGAFEEVVGRARKARA